MREWIPTSASARGRLVRAALEAFGGRGYAGVSVAELAAAAGTTTGPLYHHFGSKLGLYREVRDDVERRVVDRIEGAFAAVSDAGEPPPGADTMALTVAFDYVARAGFAAMLAEPDPDRRGDAIADALADAMGRGIPRASMLAAAWRAALAAVVDGHRPGDVRSALADLRMSRGP